MSKNNLQDLVSLCCEKMRQEGYSELTVTIYRRRWQHGIIPYAQQQRIEDFTPELGMQFLDTICYGLSKSTQNAHKRTINLLTIFHRTGEIPKRIIRSSELPLEGEIGTYALQFLDSLRRERLSEKTITGYRRFLNYFIQGLSHKGIASISGVTEKDIIDFVDHAQVCKSKHARAIRKFCRFLYASNITKIDMGYVLEGTRFPEKEKLPSVYSEEEISKMAVSIEQSSNIGKRDYAIFIIASRLGLRASDIVALTWNDIDWDRHKIILYQTKTKIPVELPLLKEIGDALVTYARDSRPKSQYKEVFLTGLAPFRPLVPASVHNVINRIIRQSGVNIAGRHHGPHSLRHSLASNMLSNGASLPTISGILGHQSTQTTMEYLRVDIKKLRECILPVSLVDEKFFNQKGGLFYD